MQVQKRIHPIYKLTIAFICAMIFLFISASFQIENLTKVMISWDIFGLVYLGISLHTFFATHTTTIRHTAQSQDTTYKAILTVLSAAIFCSVVAVLFLLSSQDKWLLPKRLVALIYLSGVIISWALTHTLLAFHYAHLFYGDEDGPEPARREGLKFPNQTDPDYLDFAYFSFVVGMTFQVSDVVITSKRIRHIVLLHSLVSFIFNTAIVALTINALVKS